LDNFTATFSKITIYRICYPVQHQALNAAQKTFEQLFVPRIRNLTPGLPFENEVLQTLFLSPKTSQISILSVWLKLTSNFSLILDLK
jgi:hypothetical protein